MTGFLKTSALLSVAAVVASLPLDANAGKETGTLGFENVGDKDSCPVPPWTPEETALRTRQKYVQFDQPFATTPTVFLSITGMDADTANGMRYSMSADYVSPYGFLLKFGTWCHSYYYGVNISWLAIE